MHYPINKWTLEYHRFDIPEGITVNESNESPKYIICSCYYLPKFNFIFQSEICDGCHYLMQKAINFNNVLIVFTGKNDYKINFWYISKDNAINISDKF